MAAAIAAAAVAIMVVAYARELKSQRDATSAVAALITIAIGFLAGSGSEGLAMACAAVVVLLLALRTELHGFVEQLDENDVKALARFAVIAGAVLPLLPNQPFGPYGAWNAQKLWLVVVLVTGFSFAGYIANRIFGERRGNGRHGADRRGLFVNRGDGLARASARQGQAGGRPGARRNRAGDGGDVFAGPAPGWRAGDFGAVADRDHHRSSARRRGGRRIRPVANERHRRAKAPTPPGNPIQLVPALGFLVFLAVAAVAARWAEGRFGEQGIAVLLLITGSLDVDAAIITTGGLKRGTISPGLAALALGGTVMANMAVKVGVTLAYARSRGASAALALVASMVALGIGLWIGWMRL